MSKNKKGVFCDEEILRKHEIHNIVVSLLLECLFFF